MTVQKFQVMSMGSQQDGEPTMHYQSTQSGVSSHKIVDGKGGRLREALREAWNNYGKADNTELIQVLEEDGYDVRRTAGGGIVLKGNEFSDWTTWREVRETFKKV